jgi:hypothetical protein
LATAPPRSGHGRDHADLSSSAHARSGRSKALFRKTYRHLYEGEKRTQANRLQVLVEDALDEEGTTDLEETQNPRASGGFVNGRYWARTSDPQLVDTK